MTNEEYRKEMHQAITQYENFFKHADKDPDDLIEFKPDLTQLFLLDAIETYQNLTGEITHTLKAFRIWYLCNNPNVIKEEVRTDYMKRFEAFKKEAGSTAKQEFFTLLLKTMAMNESA